LRPRTRAAETAKIGLCLGLGLRESTSSRVIATPQDAQLKGRNHDLRAAKEGEHGGIGCKPMSILPDDAPVVVLSGCRSPHVDQQSPSWSRSDGSTIVGIWSGPSRGAEQLSRGFRQSSRIRFVYDGRGTSPRDVPLAITPRSSRFPAAGTGAARDGPSRWGPIMANINPPPQVGSE